MTRPQLDKSEWDFRPCIDTELDTCWRYELEREKWKSNPPTAKNVSLWKSISSIGSPHDKVIFSIADFPEKPWLSLDRGNRKKIVQQIQHEISSLEAHLVRADFGEGETTSFRFDEIPQDANITTVVMKLDWRKSDRKLRMEFEAILSNLREGKSQAKNTGRKGVVKDKLNALGALRLLRHFKGEADAALQHAESHNVELWAEERAFCRAADRAASLISGKVSKPMSS
jgi:hypothetical protein